MVATSAWGLVVLRPRLRRLAMRTRRDATAAIKVAAVLAAERRLLWVNPVLAVLALLLGALADASPNRVSAAQAAHRAVTLEHKGRSIAVALHVSERAVEKHTSAIFAKLGLGEEKDVNRRVKAVLLFLSRGEQD